MQFRLGYLSCILIIFLMLVTGTQAKSGDKPTPILDGIAKLFGFKKQTDDTSTTATAEMSASVNASINAETPIAPPIAPEIPQVSATSQTIATPDNPVMNANRVEEPPKTDTATPAVATPPDEPPKPAQGIPNVSPVEIKKDLPSNPVSPNPPLTNPPQNGSPAPAQVKTPVGPASEAKPAAAAAAATTDSSPSTQPTKASTLPSAASPLDSNSSSEESDKASPANSNNVGIYVGVAIAIIGALIGLIAFYRYKNMQKKDQKLDDLMDGKMDMDHSMDFKSPKFFSGSYNFKNAVQAPPIEYYSGPMTPSESPSPVDVGSAQSFNHENDWFTATPTIETKSPPNTPKFDEAQAPNEPYSISPVSPIKSRMTKSGTGHFSPLAMKLLSKIEPVSKPSMPLVIQTDSTNQRLQNSTISYNNTSPLSSPLTPDQEYTAMALASCAQAAADRDYRMSGSSMASYDSLDL